FTETWSAAAVVNAGIPILYGGIMSVGVAYTLQTVAQRTAHPAHAAIILSLEGAFAALGGWLILGETMSPRGMAGCALMFAGVLCAQWDVIGKAVFFRFPEEHQG
ncbi:MAG: EamA family transporter, partial [Spirochaetales bacterium]|nr:EamA family transporter [Spirochaetales bacterium]